VRAARRQTVYETVIMFWVGNAPRERGVTFVELVSTWQRSR